MYTTGQERMRRGTIMWKFHKHSTAVMQSMWLSPTTRPFTRAAHVGDGWLQLDWFDLFNADQFPWIFHPAMGWIYMLGNDSDNLWMWHPELGWHWTSKSVYPQIYLANDTAWAFLSTANATTQIYNYQTGEWGVLAP